jgi:DNA-binding NtrC family response regulator
MLDEEKSLGPECRSDTPGLANRSQSVFVLSNDRYFCSLVRSYLESAGLNVFTCSTVDRADSTFLNRCQFDLTVIDVQSLGITAVFFAQHFSELRPEIPVLIIEGARPDEAVLRSFMIDNWTKARKPVELPDLLAAIHGLLNRGSIEESHNAGGSGHRSSDARSAEDRRGEFRQGKFQLSRFQSIEGGITRHGNSRN